MTAPFWQGKRVLVTGHTGFKGAWLSLCLQRMGAQVAGFALAPRTPEDLFEVARIGDCMSSELGDIRDVEHIREAVRRFQPDVVFHLAAQSLVRTSYREPVETYATNVMGTVHLLEAIRVTDSVRVVVCVTSDKCYENREWVWGYREDDPMGGHDPYSSSKGCTELVVSAYRRSFFAPDPDERPDVILASARAGNVIGGGDWAEDRLVPDMMRAIFAAKPALIRNPGAVRPWQYVLDPLRGYLMLAEKLWVEGARFAGGWNFGPEAMDARPVSWMADRICELWADGAEWTGDGGQHPHEATYLRLDSSKARQLLGWNPRVDLATALDWCVEWYRGREKQQDVRKLAEAQIDRFIGMETS